MAKLIQCNVPATNIRRSRAFYQALFGELQFARSLTDKVDAYHQPISSDGIQLTISPKQADQEQIMCYFAVDDLDATLTALERLGGTVVYEPFTLTISPAVLADYAARVKEYHPEVKEAVGDTGRSAIVQDPDGNLLGLTELRPQAYWLFKYGQFRVALDADQVAQHQRAIELSKKLTPLS